jgi:phosphoribosyl-ATP pyrophosphohydrolase
MEIMKKVFEIIEDRKVNPKKGSYVCSIIGDVDKILAKIEEESDELAKACEKTKEEIIHEATDLVFHIMILLASKNIKLEEIEEEFERRRKE